MIEFVIQMSKFHRRFHWMLSALAQQIDPPPFRLRVDLDLHDPYGHHTKGLMRSFHRLLKIHWIGHDGDDFLQRGFLRDQAIQQSDTDWLLFSDADVLYPPTFLRDLSARYLQGEYDDKLLSVVRHSTSVRAADEIINAADYSRPVPKAFGQAYRACGERPYKTSKARATGYFQLCRRDAALRTGLPYYRDAVNRDRPINHDTGSGLRSGRSLSDCRFRIGWKVVKLDLPPLIHLMHIREWEKAWDGKLR